MSRLRAILPAAGLVWAVSAGAIAADSDERDLNANKTVVLGVTTSIGNIGLSMTNIGFIGNTLSPTVSWPSCEYPLHSGVEHIYVGGIWVGAINAEGDTLVSCGSDDAWSGQAGPKQEFGPRVEDTVTQLSNNALSPYFSTRALADQHFEFSFEDLNPTSDLPADPHQPLGVRVHTRALAYAPSYADDFVILDLTVENISGQEMDDVFLGFYIEFSVGNTAITIPGDDTNGWNFFDDVNGFLGAGDVEDDPDARLGYSFDADGENGRAESWAGIRLLGAGDPVEKFAYRQWQYRQPTWPRFDGDKYRYMSSEQIDVGENPNGTNFSAILNWSNMMAVGPWETFFPGDSVSVTIAIVAGSDSLELVQNSQVAQAVFDEGFDLPSGPPSPRLDVSVGNHEVTLRWNPGVEPVGQYDASTASPEFHRSEFTNDYDFQGYRIYRIQGDAISTDPFEQASLIAQFDRVTWPDGSLDDDGFNVGLPRMNANGQREFVDTGVLNGFSYYYAVTSYSARDPRLGLPELESGFNENALRIVPGSAPGGSSRPPVGVYPNPYRGSSLFDSRRPTGEPAELGRAIYFTNVPANARILIFNLAGTQVDQLEHHDTTTGQVEWDMLSEHTRAIAPGLYIYSVEDMDTGEIQRGKLVIIK